ncbi:permease-like cell division protein FtsX [Asanoa ishikariensis]|uniref:permease-like cell division protein FtsX n=1 Tax=Asanoa ishikariensis TaxID=137265 RepID=UPI000B80FA66|nr:permease-like cell division protein FtsX [Asanoa ishikariensis]
MFATVLSACGDDAQPLPARVLVVLDDEVATSHAGVEQRIRTMPGVTDIVLTTKEQAYEAYQRNSSDRPEAARNVRPGDLPASLQVTVTDLWHAEAVQLAIGTFDGVQDTSLSVGAGDMTAQEWMGFIVPLEESASPGERAAVEQFIRGLPGVDTVTFETPEQTRDRLRERCRDHAELAAAFAQVELADIPASFRFRLEVGLKAPRLAELMNLDGVTPYSFVPAELVKD